MPESSVPRSRRKLPIGTTERWLLLVILAMGVGLGLSTGTFLTLPRISSILPTAVPSTSSSASGSWSC